MYPTTCTHAIHQPAPSIKIHYSQWQSSGPPVLLLHGMADHRLVWLSLGDALRDQYHVVAPDLRGHGESSKPQQGYDSATIIHDLRSLMHSLGWMQAHILGHSWAGKVACLWATQFPDDFASLILVDPFFIRTIPRWTRITFPLFYQVLPFLKTMGPFKTYAEAEALGQTLKQFREWTPLQQTAFKFAMEEKGHGQWGSKFTTAARNEIFEDVMVTAGLTTVLSQPALLVRPDKGLNRSRWQLQPYYDYLPQLQVISIPGHHWSFLSDPDHFNPIVRQFLDQQSTHSIQCSDN